jgi:hypothetical protein
MKLAGGERGPETAFVVPPCGVPAGLTHLQTLPALRMHQCILARFPSCAAPALQLTLLGSDGRRYTFLAKPKDDLRKDNRMMEAAGVLNRLFASHPAARRRNLYLRWVGGWVGVHGGLGEYVQGRWCGPAVWGSCAAAGSCQGGSALPFVSLPRWESAPSAPSHRSRLLLAISTHVLTCFTTTTKHATSQHTPAASHHHLCYTPLPPPAARPQPLCGAAHRRGQRHRGVGAPHRGAAPLPQRHVRGGGAVRGQQHQPQGAAHLGRRAGESAGEGGRRVGVCDGRERAC